MSKAPTAKLRKPTVSIIGPGRLGTALAVALSARGYSVEAVVGRTPGSSRRVASRLGSGTLRLSTKQLDRLPNTQFVFITTPDGTILNVAKHLAGLKASALGRVVLHTSGALASTEVLAPLAAVGFETGSLHPLVSISTQRSAADKLHGAFYCIEGTGAARKAAVSIVRDLGGHSFQIAAKDKPLYHAAAVMASGHVTSLVGLSIGMLVECGLDEQTARRVLMPLLESTVANLSETNAASALTGTFARGDLDTVRRHLQALSGKRFAQVLAAYKLLGRSSLDLVKQRIDPRAVNQILRELK